MKIKYLPVDEKSEQQSMPNEPEKALEESKQEERMTESQLQKIRDEVRKELKKERMRQQEELVTVQETRRKRIPNYLTQLQELEGKFVWDTYGIMKFNFSKIYSDLQTINTIAQEMNELLYDQHPEKRIDLLDIDNITAKMKENSEAYKSEWEKPEHKALLAEWDRKSKIFKEAGRIFDLTDSETDFERSNRAFNDSNIDFKACENYREIHIYPYSKEYESLLDSIEIYCKNLIHLFSQVHN